MSVAVESNLSQKLKNMGLLCSLLVVSIHIDWPHEECFSLGWFLYEGLKNTLAGIAVPFFFVVSGYFLSKHFNETGWWRHEVIKRVKSLLVPFVIWTLVFLAATLPVSLFADLMAHRSIGTSIPSNSVDWLKLTGFDITDFPTLYPLWYLRCLFLFVLTAVVFKAGIEKIAIVWLLATFSLMVFSSLIPHPLIKRFLRVGYSASGMFYFSLGIFLNMKHCRKFEWCVPWLLNVAIIILMMALNLALACSSFVDCRQFIYKVSVFLMLGLVWDLVPSRAIAGRITSCAFPIYIMHPIALFYLGLLFGDKGVCAAIASYFAAIVLTSCASLAMRKYVPRFSAMAFGGR